MFHAMGRGGLRAACFMPRGKAGACGALALAVAAILVTASAAPAADSTWIGPADANWNSPGVWSGAVPSLAGDTACLTRNIDANLTISIWGQSVRLGRLVISDPSPTVGWGDPNRLLFNAYTIRSAAGGSLTFDSGVAGQPAILEIAQSSPAIGPLMPHVLNIPVTLASSLRACATGEAAIRGAVSGPGGIVLAAGAGTLALESNSNTFAGGVAVLGGTLRACAPGSLGACPAVTLGGGTLLLWTGAAGPASWNKNLIVTGDSAIAVDGAEAFAGGLHVLGGLEMAAGATLAVSNANDFELKFAGAAHLAGRATFCARTWGRNLTLGGAILGGGTLVKTGEGFMTLAGSDANFTGGVEIRGGLMTLVGSAVLKNASRFIVDRKGTFLVDNAEVNLCDRLGDSNVVTMLGGEFQFAGAANAASAETAGPLALARGDSWIINRAGGGGSAALTFSSFTRAVGSAVQFDNSDLGGASGWVRLDCDGNRVPVIGGILGGWATVGAEWAAYDAALGVRELPLAASLAEANDRAWFSLSNVRPTTSVALTANRVINSLNLVAGGNVNLGGRTLNLASGGLLSAGGNRVIDSGVLTAGGSAGGELFAFVQAGRTLTIGAAIYNAGPAAPVTLVKNGAGTLVLAGAGAYAGGTYVNDGVLEAAPAAESNGSPLGTGPLRLNSATAILSGDSSLAWAGSLAATGESTIRLASSAADANLFSGAMYALGEATNDGSLTVVSDCGASAVLELGALTGAGSVTVADDTVLAVERVVQDSIVVGAGGVLVIGGADNSPAGGTTVAANRPAWWLARQPAAPGAQGNPAAVPEPAAAFAIASGFCAILRRRRARRGQGGGRRRIGFGRPRSPAHAPRCLVKNRLL
jgi:fibronectin-binding autotransporter adhesin